MKRATLTTNGRVTIPAVVRRELGLKVGDRILFVMNPTTGRYEMICATRSVLSLKGLIAKSRASVSVEDMNAAGVQTGASGH